MKIHKINLENYYRNAVDSAIAKMNGLPEAIFAGRPTYNEVALKFAAGETPVLALPQWAQFTIDLTKDKPSWAPATGTLKATFSASVSGVEAGDTMNLDAEKVYGASVTATAKQYTVNEGKYTVVIQANILNGDDEVVLSFTGQAMKVAMTKEGDTGPDTTLDIDQVGSFTQQQSDWNQSDDTAVDFIKNKPTIPAAQVNADWNATSGVSEILNKPTIPTVNDATLTFTQDGETLATFSANASTNVEVEIPAGGGGGGASIIETTWADLKALKDGGTLTPGQTYRITDYTCTTAQSYTSSAGNVFDILVVADDTNHLNEQARAALHSGDTYFANCKLEAWKLWYCIDNDTTRFAWADTTNGKGVIYRMIDEWENDVPYDFKNIKFRRYNDSSSAQHHYTFEGPFITDGSLGGTYVSKRNVILPDTSQTDAPRINRIWLSQRCIGNTFDRNCHEINLDPNCENNTFGQNCYQNVLGQSCNRNTVGNECYYIGFGQNCSYNIIGNQASLTCGNSCYYNIIEPWSTIRFGDGPTTTRSYIQYCVVKTGNNSIRLNPTNTSSSNIYQYAVIDMGVNGGSPWITISDSNTNQAYQTTFFKETDGTLKKQEGSTITTVA